MENQKLTFDEKQVRKSFKSRFCGEFVLPSGKPSGYYKFPITDEEINEFMDGCQETKPKQFLTWSEWALWSALRHKYGIKYLYQRTKQGWWLLRGDVPDVPSTEEYNLEEKLQFYIDCKLEQVQELACRTVTNAQPEPDTENSKKNFRESLDNSNLDVLY